MKIINSIFKTFLVALLLAAQVHFAYAQSAALLPVAPQQFFDKNGNPVTSGSVGYYIPGTSTPKMVWQDDSQTTPWTNPITLNAGGWPPNNKGIYGNGTYRQIIKDKNQNIISDQPTSATGSGGGSGTSVGDGNSVGTILAWSGMLAPNQYQFAYGQALSRATFPELLQAITQLSNITCVGGNQTLTGIGDTSNIPIGAAIEANCVVAGSTVLSKTLNTVTISIAASISTTASGRFFPYGNGNGTTTFNVPDLRGRVIPGRNNMGGIVSSNLTSTYYGSEPDAVGAAGGNQSKTILTANLPPYTPLGTIAIAPHTHSVHGTVGAAVNAAGYNTAATPGSNAAWGAAQPNLYGATDPTTATGTFTGTAQGGTSTPISLVQPSLTLNYVIKVTPDTSVSGLFGVASIGGMQGIIACGAGLTCAGNIISSSASSAGGADTQVQYNSGGGFAGNAAFIWVSPKLTIGLNGTTTGQLALAGATSGSLTQTVGSVAGTPIITWGNGTGTPAVTASTPLVLNTTTGNLTITGAALTKTDDTNVTLTLGGAAATSLVNAASLTLGWTGTLAAGRLNSNVVQSVINGTNITGSISAQALTLGWTGTLALNLGGTGASTALAARSGSNLNIDQLTSVGDANAAIASTTRVIGTTTTLTSARTWTLPAANAVNAGQYLLVADYAGAINGANTLAVSRAGSDTINGGTSITITAVNGAYLFVSDGVSKWTGQSLGAASAGGVSSVTCGTGLSGGTITTSGTCAVDIATTTNIWSGTSNKIIDAAGAGAGLGLTTLTDSVSGTVSIDMATGVNFSLTMTAGSNTRALGNPTNTVVGRCGVIWLVQNASGPNLVTYGSNWKFAGGTIPAASTSASAVDMLSYCVRSSTFIAASLNKAFQ